MYIMLHAKCKVHGKVGEEPGRFFGGALIFRVGMIFARVMAHCYPLRARQDCSLFRQWGLEMRATRLCD